jgi:hypothetical protein
MATQKMVTEESEQPQEAWTRWAQAHADVLERATGPQRVLLEAAVRFVAAIVRQPIMTRMAAFFLLLAGMGLTPAQVGVAIGRTDRAMRNVQALSVHDLLESIWGELRRHRQPKLHAFREALGIERIFHFETLDDVGFALLSGGRRVLSRSRLGGLLRAVKTPAVKAFIRATERLNALRHQRVTLSLDEHAIARFTRKFRIPKGFHTIRNKRMRIEKLFFLYWPAQRRFL